MKCKRGRGSVVPIGVFAIVVLSVLVLKAQEEPSRHHDAHEHGVAHLNVAVEDADLYLEFISPAANIVGFEHSPRTDAQKATVKAAVDKLKEGEAMILRPSDAQSWLADCNVDTDIDDEKTTG